MCQSPETSNLKIKIKTIARGRSAARFYSKFLRWRKGTVFLLWGCMWTEQ